VTELGAKNINAHENLKGEITCWRVLGGEKCHDEGGKIPHHGIYG
jgi:hypothetical protein